MLRERIVLEEQLKFIFSKYANNGKVKDTIENNFIQKGISPSDANDILTKRIDIRVVTDVILYITVKSLYESIEMIEDKNTVNPTKWFTSWEIDEYNKYKEEKIEEEAQMIFENVYRKSSDYFIVPAEPIQNFVKKMNFRNIKYNTNTQRKTKISERNGVYFETIDVSQTQVSKIQKSILSGEQFPNFLILNLLQNGYDEIEFIPYKGSNVYGTLIIKSGEVDALDGFHRMLASIHAVNYSVKENISLDFNWGIIIVNYDETKARQFMLQEQKGRKMNKEYAKSLDINRLENLTVKKINESSEYDFYKKIVSTENDIRVGIGWTKFNIFEDAILECFGDELKTKINTNNISEKVCKGLEQIIGLNIEDFINKDSVNTSVINHKNIYPLYIYLIKKVIDIPDWKDKIYNIISSIDFNNENSFWNEANVINSQNKDISKSGKLKLYNFIDEKLREVEL